MKLETLEDYDYEIKNLDNNIKEVEKYLEEHPKKQGVKGNLETLYYVYNQLVERKKLFIKKIEDRKFLEKLRYEVTTNSGVWCTDSKKAIKKIDENCVWYIDENIDLLNEIDEKIKELS